MRDDIKDEEEKTKRTIMRIKRKREESVRSLGNDTRNQTELPNITLSFHPLLVLLPSLLLLLLLVGRC